MQELVVSLLWGIKFVETQEYLLGGTYCYYRSILGKEETAELASWSSHELLSKHLQRCIVS